MKNPAKPPGFFRQGFRSLCVVELMRVTAGTVMPSTVSYLRAEQSSAQRSDRQNTHALPLHGAHTIQTVLPEKGASAALLLAAHQKKPSS